MASSPVTAGGTPDRPSPTALPVDGFDLAEPTGAAASIETPSCRDELDAVFRALRRGPQPDGCEPISRRKPGGWVLATETWSDIAGRAAVIERYLARAERVVHDRLNPRAQRTWLLGRIAVKDAVVAWHADRGRSVAPTTVVVTNDDDGRPRLARHHGADLHVSIAHLPWAAVAVVAEGHSVGIDVEEVADRPESFRRVAFTAGERRDRRAGVAAGLDDPHAGISDAMWMAAAWCAKEAIGKAEGTGLQGRPSAFATSLAGPDRFVVRDRTVAWHVLDPREVTSAQGRALVVAWTLAPAPVLDLTEAPDPAVTATGLDAALGAVLAADRAVSAGAARPADLVPSIARSDP